MTKILATIAVVLTILVSPAVASAQQGAPRVFGLPNQGQTQTQQSSDMAACRAWASEQAPPSQAPTGPTSSYSTASRTDRNVVSSSRSRLTHRASLRSECPPGQHSQRIQSEAPCSDRATAKPPVAKGQERRVVQG